MTYQACRQRKNKEGGTPFTNWLRCQPGLESNLHVGFVNTDLDIVWYNYVKAKLMIIEQKLGEEAYTPSQRTTHSVLDQYLRFASCSPEVRLHTPRGCLPIPAKVDYCGLHLIRLEDASHDEENVWLGNGRIWIDDRQVSKEKLYRFLKFEWMPDTQLQPIVDDSLIRQAFHDHTYACLQDMLNGCLVDGTLQDTLDDLKDLVLRYDSLLHNRRSRYAKKRNEIMRLRGQLELFQEQAV